MPKRLLIVVLAWNEEQSVGDTVREIRGALPDADVAVVDDGSTDATAAKAREAGATVLRHPFNVGVAAAESTGLLFARRQGYDAVVRMDGDGQHDPGSVAAILGSLASGADLVIGSRMLGSGQFRSTGVRRIGMAMLSGLLSRLCAQPITDPTSGFRGFGPKAIAFFATRAPHEYPEPESALRATRNGLEVTEVGVRMRERRAGTSSLTPLRSAFYMVKVSFALLFERFRTP